MTTAPRSPARVAISGPAGSTPGKTRAPSRARKRAQLEQALALAHGAWSGAMDGVMQLPGDTADAQAFNVAQFEACMEAWVAFCRIYGAEMERVRGHLTGEQS